MKRGIKLLLFLAVLVLTVVFYAVATAIAKREEEKNKKDEIPDATVVLVDKQVKDLDSFAIKTKDIDVSIYVEDSVYKRATDADFPVDQIVAGKLALGLAKVSFLRKLEVAVTDPAEFGLDEPVGTFSAVYDDKSTVSLTVGDYNRHAGGHYCMTADGTLYLIDATFLEAFAYTEQELLQDDYVTDPKKALDSITAIEVLFRDGNGFTYAPIKTEVPADTAEGSTATKTVTVWEKTLLDGTKAEGDFTETVEKLYSQLFDVKLDKWADYNVTGKDKLSQYGLDEPAITVTVRYSEELIIAGETGGANVTTTVDKVQGFLIGNMVPVEEPEAPETEADTSADTSTDGKEDEKETETRYYFMLEGKKIVYTLTEKELSSVLPASES
jgi:hypothetical protein